MSSTQPPEIRSTALRIAGLALGAGGAALWIAWALRWLFASPIAPGDAWLPAGATAIAALLCAARAALLATERRAWTLMSGALALGAAALAAGAAPDHIPGLAASARTGFALFLGAGSVELVRSRLVRPRLPTVLDALVASTWIAAVATLALLPVLHGAFGAAGERARILVAAVPLGVDIVLLGFGVAVIAMFGLVPGRWWGTMAAAVTVLGVADATSVHEVARTGAGAVVGVAAGLTALGAMLIALGAWQAVPPRVPPRVPTAVRALAIPASLGLSATALLGVGNHVDLGPVGFCLVVATIVAAVARMVAAFVEHRNVNRALRTAAALAATDHLTGLANHRTFHDALRSEVKRVHRTGRDLSLVVLDLDSFKAVNDRFGHQVGDQLLQEVAARLSRQMREGDTLARVGGEEFAWILPETDGATAWRVADRAREAIAARPFPRVGTVTISAGVCDLAEASTAAELFRMADAALYRAKDLGRNVVFRHTAEMADIISGDREGDRTVYSATHEAVRALARAVDGRDPVSRHHATRVASLSVDIALAMGWQPARAALLHEAALLHDIGKIGIPERLLLKQHPLTSAEYTEIKAHAGLGADIVRGVLTPEQGAWVRSHHEHVDGTGYPEGLGGASIPDGALILAVADAWDVITTGRTYREPWPAADAIAELRRGAGTQWSPEVVRALVQIVHEGGLRGPRPGGHAARIPVPPPARDRTPLR